MIHDQEGKRSSHKDVRNVCSGDEQQQLRRLRALKKYKKRVAKDRANARRGGMKLPAKREAPEDVDNSTSLPPAKRDIAIPSIAVILVHALSAIWNKGKSTTI